MRAASRLLARALAGAALALVLALVGPLAFGGRPLVVLSGSMEPALRVGDVVVVEQVHPLDVRVGDIVTFRDPAREERLTSHRVRDLSVQGSRVRIVTQGDANNASERWNVSSSQTIGRAVLRIPLVGHALLVLRRPGGEIACALLLLLVGAVELRAIWRPRTTGAGNARPAA